MTPAHNDLINGGFESMSGLLGWINVTKLVKDKQVKGVYWPMTFFFTIWGLWNLWYYPALHQSWSFIGGLVIVSSNAVWVAIAIMYSHRTRASVTKV